MAARTAALKETALGKLEPAAAMKAFEQLLLADAPCVGVSRIKSRKLCGPGA